MSMRSLNRLLVACGVAAIVGVTSGVAQSAGNAGPQAVESRAQTPSQPSGVGFRDSVSVQWVGVPVEVPPNLDPQDVDVDSFLLTVDGRPVPIHDFEGPVAEVALIYVQDLSGSMALGGKLEVSKQIYAALQDSLGPSDELGVLTFSDVSTSITVPLGTASARHRTEPEDWRGWGLSAIRDALLEAPAFARDSRRARTGIVLVTDGNDNASDISTEQLHALLSASAVPLYLFDLSTTGGESTVPSESEATSTSERTASLDSLDSLRKLARASGGATYRLSEHLTVDKAADALVHRLGRQYWLTFPADSSTANRPHRIHVSLDTRATGGREHGWRVLHHRSHYIGGSPLETP